MSVTTCISDANPLVAGADYFDANNRLTRDGVRRGAADIEFANEFSVHYEQYYKVVKTSCNNVQASWDCVPKTYVLRMCGSTAPTSFANGTAFPSGTRHFSVPLQGVATALSPALSFIELLGKRDTLKQVSTGSGFYSPCIQQLEEAGSIRGLNEYGLSQETAWRAAIAADSTVDGVFTDSWDPDGDNYNYINCADNCGTGATDTDLDIVFDAASDTGGPLGRAEWIKYIALFFNEEDRANAYHKREVEAWTKYSDLAAAEAAGVSARTCAWVNSGWSGRSASFTTYKTDYCTAAGLTAVTDAADLALATPTYTTTYADAAAFKAALATFDVIIDESYLSGGTSKADVLSNLGVAESDLKTGAILLRVDRHKSDTVVHADSVAARSSEDWFESGVTRPALVLHDLLFHVWPDAFTEPAAGCSRFFRNVLADETITEHGGAHCDTWSAADEEGRCLTNTIKDTDPYLAANAAPGSVAPPLRIATLAAALGALALLA